MNKTPYPYSINGKKAIAKAKKIENNAVKKPIAKIDKNRIYAWILLVLMAFWTFASVVSLVHTFGGKSSMSSISAGAEGVDYNEMTIDPFEFPTANLLNWPYYHDATNYDSSASGLSFEVDNSGLIHVNGIMAVSGWTYRVNNANTYFFPGATYTLNCYDFNNPNERSYKAVFSLRVERTGGTLEYLVDSRMLGYPQTFTVPNDAVFLYLDIVFVQSYMGQGYQYNDLTLALMYNQGSTAYPYQPPYQLVYENGYNVGTEDGFDGGYQDGLISAKYGFWIDCAINGTLVVNHSTLSDVSQTIHFSNAPFTYLSNGIDLTPLISYFENLVPSSYYFSSASFSLVFNPNVDLTMFRLFAYGLSDVFAVDGVPIIYNINTSKGVVRARFIEREEYGVGAYGLQLYTDELNTSIGSVVSSMGVFNFNTLQSLQGLKFVSQYTGYVEGYENGLSQGKNDYINSQEYKDYIASIKDQAYKNGKSVGFSEGLQNANDYSFFGLLSSVVDAPIKMFSDMFNFEILGVNLSNFALGLLTLALVLGVVKLIL